MRTPAASGLMGRPERAFTLVEVLVSIAVLTLVVLGVAGLMNSASSLTVMGGKHISTDTQARVVLDRMAVDFARMLKRSDVDYYLKTDNPANYPGHSYGHSQGHGQGGQSSNDQIAFFTQVPGYYPAGAQSPISLVAYRVNSNTSTTYTSPNYNKLQRMAIGLLWNGYSNGNYHNQGYTCPIFFLPSSYWVGDPAQPNTPGAGYYINQPWAWPNAIATADDPAYETIGPGVFRFEYYYLLKNGHISQNPFINNADPTAPHYRDVNGLNDVEAIAVSIAVIDSRNRALLTDQNILDLAAKMADFNTINQHPPPIHTYAQANDVEIQWNCVATNGAAGNCNLGTVTFPDPTITAMPQAAVSGIRVYTRYFDLNNL
jgi:prepilin-type N-terminal cleavage/methylation domain-containing protein